MKWTIVNQDEIPDDLPVGTYCCHLEEGSTLEEMRIRADLTKLHEPGDCLIQIVKDEKTEPTASV